jgi:hypothetical protein
MSSVFVRHRVADYDAWKAVFDEHAGARRDHGLTDAGLFRDADDPAVVIIVMTTDDVERARAFAGSDDLRETMQRAGVVSQPEVWIGTDA